ncbi:hypothetical protein EYF80_045599 [Liparis tanakae]|uniref:Uncharacterized protein n=1 Tax=Liparis tanakae TaxID=230148 RepID=A0A4Z2FU22_9TELE|nr:hypothetical protein EYF80_045599 [Liparis tanakae]
MPSESNYQFLEISGICFVSQHRRGRGRRSVGSVLPWSLNVVKPDDIMQVHQQRPVHRGLDPDPVETSPPWTRPRSSRDQSTVD